jgi:hypothetical protein
MDFVSSEEDLQELFSQFRELSQVHLVLDKETKRSKGFAYVLYMLPESASRFFIRLCSYVCLFNVSFGSLEANAMFSS